METSPNLQIQQPQPFCFIRNSSIRSFVCIKYYPLCMIFSSSLHLQASEINQPLSYNLPLLLQPLPYYNLTSHQQNQSHTYTYPKFIQSSSSFLPFSP